MSEDYLKEEIVHLELKMIKLREKLKKRNKEIELLSQNTSRTGFIHYIDNDASEGETGKKSIECDLIEGSRGDLVSELLWLRSENGRLSTIVQQNEERVERMKKRTEGERQTAEIQARDHALLVEATQNVEALTERLKDRNRIVAELTAENELLKSEVELNQRVRNSAEEQLRSLALTKETEHTLLAAESLSYKRQLEDERTKNEELQKAVEIAANETARTVRDKLREAELKITQLTRKAETAEALVEHHRSANSVLLARMESCIAEHPPLITDEHWQGLVEATEILQNAELSSLEQPDHENFLIQGLQGREAPLKKFPLLVDEFEVSRDKDQDIKVDEHNVESPTKTSIVTTHKMTSPSNKPIDSQLAHHLISETNLIDNKDNLAINTQKNELSLQQPAGSNHIQTENNNNENQESQFARRLSIALEREQITSAQSKNLSSDTNHASLKENNEISPSIGARLRPLVNALRKNKTSDKEYQLLQTANNANLQEIETLKAKLHDTKTEVDNAKSELEATRDIMALRLMQLESIVTKTEVEAELKTEDLSRKNQDEIQRLNEEMQRRLLSETTKVRTDCDYFFSKERNILQQQLATSRKIISDVKSSKETETSSLQEKLDAVSRELQRSRQTSAILKLQSEFAGSFALVFRREYIKSQLRTLRHLLATSFGVQSGRIRLIEYCEMPDSVPFEQRADFPLIPDGEDSKISVVADTAHSVHKVTENPFFMCDLEREMLELISTNNINSGNGGNDSYINNNSSTTNIFQLNSDISSNNNNNSRFLDSDDADLAALVARQKWIESLKFKEALKRLAISQQRWDEAQQQALEERKNSLNHMPKIHTYNNSATSNSNNQINSNTNNRSGLKVPTVNIIKENGVEPAKTTAEHNTNSTRQQLQSGEVSPPVNATSPSLADRLASIQADEVKSREGNIEGNDELSEGDASTTDNNNLTEARDSAFQKFLEMKKQIQAMMQTIDESELDNANDWTYVRILCELVENPNSSFDQRSQVLLANLCNSIQNGESILDDLGLCSIHTCRGAVAVAIEWPEHSAQLLQRRAVNVSNCMLIASIYKMHEPEALKVAAIESRNSNPHVLHLLKEDLEALLGVETAATLLLPRKPPSDPDFAGHDSLITQEAVKLLPMVIEKLKLLRKDGGLFLVAADSINSPVSVFNNTDMASDALQVALLKLKTNDFLPSRPVSRGPTAQLRALSSAQLDSDSNQIIIVKKNPLLPENVASGLPVGLGPDGAASVARLLTQECHTLTSNINTMLAMPNFNNVRHGSHQSMRNNFQWEETLSPVSNHPARGSLALTEERRMIEELIMLEDKFFVFSVTQAFNSQTANLVETKVSLCEPQSGQAITMKIDTALPEVAVLNEGRRGLVLDDSHPLGGATSNIKLHAERLVFDQNFSVMCVVEEITFPVHSITVKITYMPPGLSTWKLPGRRFHIALSLLDANDSSSLPRPNSNTINNNKYSVTEGNNQHGHNSPSRHVSNLPNMANHALVPVRLGIADCPASECSLKTSVAKQQLLSFAQAPLDECVDDKFPTSMGSISKMDFTAGKYNGIHTAASLMQRHLETSSPPEKSSKLRRNLGLNNNIRNSVGAEFDSLNRQENQMVKDDISLKTPPKNRIFDEMDANGDGYNTSGSPHFTHKAHPSQFPIPTANNDADATNNGIITSTQNSPPREHGRSVTIDVPSSSTHSPNKNNFSTANLHGSSNINKNNSSAMSSIMQTCNDISHPDNIEYSPPTCMGIRWLNMPNLSRALIPSVWTPRTKATRVLGGSKLLLFSIDATEDEKWHRFTIYDPRPRRMFSNVISDPNPSRSLSALPAPPASFASASRLATNSAGSLRERPGRKILSGKGKSSNVPQSALDTGYMLTMTLPTCRSEQPFKLLMQHVELSNRSSNKPFSGVVAMIEAPFMHSISASISIRPIENVPFTATKKVRQSNPGFGFPVDNKSYSLYPYSPNNTMNDTHMDSTLNPLDNNNFRYTHGLDSTNQRDRTDNLSAGMDEFALVASTPVNLLTEPLGELGMIHDQDSISAFEDLIDASQVGGFDPFQPERYGMNTSGPFYDGNSDSDINSVYRDSSEIDTNREGGHSNLNIQQAAAASGFLFNGDDDFDDVMAFINHIKALANADGVDFDDSMSIKSLLSARADRVPRDVRFATGGGASSARRPELVLDGGESIDAGEEVMLTVKNEMKLFGILERSTREIMSDICEELVTFGAVGPNGCGAERVILMPEGLRSSQTLSETLRADSVPVIPFQFKKPIETTRGHQLVFTTAAVFELKVRSLARDVKMGFPLSTRRSTDENLVENADASGIFAKGGSAVFEQKQKINNSTDLHISSTTSNELLGKFEETVLCDIHLCLFKMARQDSWTVTVEVVTRPPELKSSAKNGKLNTSSLSKNISSPSIDKIGSQPQLSTSLHNLSPQNYNNNNSNSNITTTKPNNLPDAASRSPASPAINNMNTTSVDEEPIDSPSSALASQIEALISGLARNPDGAVSFVHRISLPDTSYDTVTSSPANLSLFSELCELGPARLVVAALDDKRPRCVRVAFRAINGTQRPDLCIVTSPVKSCFMLGAIAPPIPTARTNYGNNGLVTTAPSFVASALKEQTLLGTTPYTNPLHPTLLTVQQFIVLDTLQNSFDACAPLADEPSEAKKIRKLNHAPAPPDAPAPTATHLDTVRALKKMRGQHQELDDNNEDDFEESIINMEEEEKKAAKKKRRDKADTEPPQVNGKPSQRLNGDPASPEILSGTVALDIFPRWRRARVELLAYFKQRFAVSSRVTPTLFSKLGNASLAEPHRIPPFQMKPPPVSRLLSGLSSIIADGTSRSNLAAELNSKLQAHLAENDDEDDNLVSIKGRDKFTLGAVDSSKSSPLGRLSDSASGAVSLDSLRKSLVGVGGGAMAQSLSTMIFLHYRTFKHPHISRDSSPASDPDFLSIRAEGGKKLTRITRFSHRSTNGGVVVWTLLREAVSLVPSMESPEIPALNISCRYGVSHYNSKNNSEKVLWLPAALLPRILADAAVLAQCPLPGEEILLTLCNAPKPFQYAYNHPSGISNNQHSNNSKNNSQNSSNNNNVNQHKNQFWLEGLSLVAARLSSHTLVALDGTESFNSKDNSNNENNNNKKQNHITLPEVSNYSKFQILPDPSNCPSICPVSPEFKSALGRIAFGLVHLHKSTNRLQLSTARASENRSLTKWTPGLSAGDDDEDDAYSGSLSNREGSSNSIMARPVNSGHKLMFDPRNVEDSRARVAVTALATRKLPSLGSNKHHAGGDNENGGQFSPSANNGLPLMLETLACVEANRVGQRYLDDPFVPGRRLMVEVFEGTNAADNVKYNINIRIRVSGLISGGSLGKDGASSVSGAADFAALAVVDLHENPDGILYNWVRSQGIMVLLNPSREADLVSCLLDHCYVPPANSTSTISRGLSDINSDLVLLNLRKYLSGERSYFNNLNIEKQ